MVLFWKLAVATALGVNGLADHLDHLNFVVMQPDRAGAVSHDKAEKGLAVYQCQGGILHVANDQGWHDNGNHASMRDAMGTMRP